MRSTRERLAELRAQIATLLWQIAMLPPDDVRREMLYSALLTRYHQSFTLYGAGSSIDRANRQSAVMDDLIAESDRLKQTARQIIKASDDAQRLLAGLYQQSDDTIARSLALIRAPLHLLQPPLPAGQA